MDNVADVFGWVAVAAFLAGGLFGPSITGWLAFGFAAATASWLLKR